MCGIDVALPPQQTFQHKAYRCRSYGLLPCPSSPMRSCASPKRNVYQPLTFVRLKKNAIDEKKIINFEWKLCYGNYVVLP
jgi:hypothetical protein